MTTNAMVLLLSDSHGVYIPQSFCEFDLSDWQGINSDDADDCLIGPESETYWDSWQNILDNASYKEGNNKFTLHQDGDLWAICPELMSNEEYANFFGEMKPAPDDSYEFAVCDDCLMALANDDYSGMDDETEKKVKAGLNQLHSEYSRVIADGAEYGFKNVTCECCGASGGDRHRVICFKDE